MGARPLLAVAAAGMAVGPLTLAAEPTVGFAVVDYGTGVGLASAGTWVATTGVVSAAFHSRRAAALGLLTAGPAAGGVVLASVMAALADAHRPRPTCVVVAMLGFTACVAGAALLGGHRAPAQSTRSCNTSAAIQEPGSCRFLIAGLLEAFAARLAARLVEVEAIQQRSGIATGQ